MASTTATTGRSLRRGRQAAQLKIESRFDSKMNFDPLHVLRTGVPSVYFCFSCGYLVNPYDAVQSECHLLVCGDCKRDVKTCHHSPPDGPHLFTKKIKDTPLHKAIERVHVRCANLDNGCTWIGPLGDHSSHIKLSPCGLSSPPQTDKRARDHPITIKDLARLYEHAYFIWSWEGKTVDGVPVLSDLRIQAPGMCGANAAASAFEACLRVKGRKVKQLCVRNLLKDFHAVRPKPNARKTLIEALAMILKEKGMVELSSDGMQLERVKISGFKKYNLRSKEGMTDAINHMHNHGPIICIHGVTEYQSNNLKSTGIIYGPSVKEADEMYARGGGEDVIQTHAVCSVGFGAEDLTSFLSYQNTLGKEVQKDGYGRVLSSSVLEALGLFICDDYEMPEGNERPLKKSKVLAHQHGSRARSGFPCSQPSTQHTRPPPPNTFVPPHPQLQRASLVMESGHMAFAKETGNDVNPAVNAVDTGNMSFEAVKGIFLDNATPNLSKHPGSRRVLHLEDYTEKQSDLCAAIAADFLNANVGELTITEVKATRSNCVLGSKPYKKGQFLYYHCNFIAKSETNQERSMYFAEVSGYERPEQCVSCVKLQDDDVEGCAFCTTVRHPEAAHFVGKIPLGETPS